MSYTSKENTVRASLGNENITLADVYREVRRLVDMEGYIIDPETEEQYFTEYYNGIDIEKEYQGIKIDTIEQFEIVEYLENNYKSFNVTITQYYVDSADKDSYVYSVIVEEELKNYMKKN